MNAVISGARIPHIAYLVVPHTVSTSGLSGPRARYAPNGYGGLGSRSAELSKQGAFVETITDQGRFYRLPTSQH
jgi:hypothetical protein